MEEKNNSPGRTIITLAHGEKCTWVRIVQHELNVLGLPFVVISVVNGCGDAESPIRAILHERRARMRVMLKSVDEGLVSTSYEDRWGQRSDPSEQWWYRQR